LNLTYSTYNVDLPNPNFEDIRRFTSNNIKRRTPGGVLKIFKDADWPVIETFIYTIARLTEAERDDLIEIFDNSVGQEITITDHLGAVRTGFIVTPVNEILTIRDDCWYDAHFEFMATIIVNIIGDCHDDLVTDTPVKDDPDYHVPPDDTDYYRIYAEDDTLMYAEDNDDLWIEAY
jgi:hypothetical protein